MNRKRKIMWIVVGVLGCVLLLGMLFFVIDYQRVKEQERPIFCIRNPARVLKDGGTVEYFGLGYKVIDFHRIVGIDETENRVVYYDEMKIGSWWMSPADFQDEYNQLLVGLNDKKESSSYLALEELPKDYSLEEAVSDRCLVITNGNQIYHQEKIEEFQKQVIQEQKAFLRIVRFTIEGDLIIDDLLYEPEKEAFETRRDQTRDKWSIPADQIITKMKSFPEKYYEMKKTEENNQIAFRLVLRKDFQEEAIQKGYQEIEICSYQKDAEDMTAKEAENQVSFFGKVIQATQDWILVEPNEGEEIRKSADKISIGLGEENDAIYEVGTNVKITYTGYIMESYPAQVHATKIELKSADRFELQFQQDLSQKKKTKKKILGKSEMKEYPYNIYTYGGNVNIIIHGETLSLRNALLESKITMDEIIEKANQDLEAKKIKGDMLKDGGTMIYQYDTYTIVKYHTINGKRDVYIGIPEMTIDQAK